MEDIERIPGHLKHRLVGSTYILGAGNDKDYMILVSNFREASKYVSLSTQFEADKDYDDDRFASYRYGDVNWIVTSNPARYEATLVAAEVCKFLKVGSRDDRIAVHRIIRDGATAENWNDPADANAFDDFEDLL